MKRRDFLKLSGAVVAGAAAPAWLQVRALAGESFELDNDIDILNFALLIAYFERSFYDRGVQENLVTGRREALLRDIRANEIDHITELREAIRSRGSDPIEEPVFEFGRAYADTEKFLANAYQFESTGVSAYLEVIGRARDRGVVEELTGIYGNECRHAALVARMNDVGPDDVFGGAVQVPKTTDFVAQVFDPYMPDRERPQA